LVGSSHTEKNRHNHSLNPLRVLLLAPGICLWVKHKDLDAHNRAKRARAARFFLAWQTHLLDRPGRTEPIVSQIKQSRGRAFPSLNGVQQELASHRLFGFILFVFLSRSVDERSKSNCHGLAHRGMAGEKQNLILPTQPEEIAESV
jgi:hypothetical protein